MRFQDAAKDARAVVYAGIQADPQVARTAGLLAVASVPLVGGLGGRGLTDPSQVVSGFGTLMWSCVGLLVAGATLAWLGVPAKQRQDVVSHPPEYHCSTAAPPAGVTTEV